MPGSYGTRHCFRHARVRGNDGIKHVMPAHAGIHPAHWRNPQMGSRVRRNDDGKSHENDEEVGAGVTDVFS